MPRRRKTMHPQVQPNAQPNPHAQPHRKTTSQTAQAVAGIVVRADGALLMQQRTAAQSYAGYWEFPGGKINADESAQMAVRRELMEEVGIAADNLRHFVRRCWTQPSGKTVVVDFFVVESYRNTPQSCEGQPLMWASPSALPSPLLPANIALCHWLQLPPFCLITAAEHLGEERMLACLGDSLTEDNKSKHCVILRDKTLPQRHDFAKRVLKLCRAHGALVFAADDKTLAAQMDGLHLSATALHSCNTRPPFAWVGASCHNAAELQKAAALGLDYALLSPVCRSQSHPQTPPLGWAQLAALSQEAGLPIYALGGLGESDLSQAQQHHAHGVAFMRHAWGAV